MAYKNKFTNFLSIDFFLFILYSFTILFLTSTIELPFSYSLRFIIPIFSIFFFFRKKIPFYNFPKEILLLVFPLITTFIFNSYLSFIAIQRLFSFFSLYLFLHYFFISYIKSKDHVKLIFNFLFITLNFISFLQIIELFNNFESFGKFQGIFQNPNYYNSHSVFALLINFIVFNLNRSKIIKLLSMCFIPLSIFMIISTGSRTGIILILVFLLIVPFIYFKKIDFHSFLYIIPVYIIFAILVLYLSNIVEIPALDRLLAFGYDDSSTGLTRGEWWERAIILYNEKPIFGWGLSSSYYNINFTTNGFIWGFHNSYLTVLVETGFIGSFFYLLFFIVSFFRIFISPKFKYRILRDYGFDSILIKLLFLSIFVFLVNGISESFLFTSGSALPFFFWFSFIFLKTYFQKL
jgi:O-antigen ligase